MINAWLDSLSLMINQASWIAPLFALLAGILTSVTPCALSSVPLVIGYVGGIEKNDTKKGFLLSVTFAFGTTVTFTVLGLMASAAGKLIGTSASWWYILLGILMTLMSLQTWEVFNFIPSVNLLSKNKKRGFIGALFAGILGGIFSSPCATPVLIVLLGILAGGGNLVWGIFLMLCYSLGHSALTIVAGTSVGFVQKLNESQPYNMFSKVMRIALGAIILMLALYMFYLGF